MSDVIKSALNPVLHRMVKVWPRERRECQWTAKTFERECRERSPRYCPQCDSYLCLKHSKGGVCAACGYECWELRWDRREDDGVGVLWAKTRDPKVYLDVWEAYGIGY